MLQRSLSQVDGELAKYLAFKFIVLGEVKTGIASSMKAHETSYQSISGCLFIMTWIPVYQLSFSPSILYLFELKLQVAPCGRIWLFGCQGAIEIIRRIQMIEVDQGNDSHLVM